MSERDSDEYDIVDLTSATQMPSGVRGNQRTAANNDVYVIESSDDEDIRGQGPAVTRNRPRNQNPNTIDLTEIDDNTQTQQPYYPEPELDDIIEVEPVFQASRITRSPSRRNPRRSARNRGQAAGERGGGGRAAQGRRSNGQRSMLDRLNRLRAMTANAQDSYLPFSWVARDTRFLGPVMRRIGLFGYEDEDNHEDYEGTGFLYDDDSASGVSLGPRFGEYHPGLHGNHFISNIPTLGRHMRGMFASEEDINNGNVERLFEQMEEARPRPAHQFKYVPLKLTKGQEELALNSQYTRNVPPINAGELSAESGDDADTAQQAPRLVCATCAEALLANVPVWAPKCGHVLCNKCVEAIKTQTKKCASCNIRIHKSSFVRLYT